MTTDNIIELKDIHKYYQNGINNTVHILKGISLNIERGDFVAIIGQSGSGKSTLMNIIGCLDTGSNGSYKVNGQEISKMTKDQLADLRCKTFGFIFQRYNLLNSLKAYENASLPAIYSGLELEAREARAKQLLSDLDLANRIENKPTELSGGQQQRVSIARALMNGGEIILADEPTGALDSNSGIMVLDIIKQLNSKGHTIVLVTHDKSIAEQANRVIEIKDGVIIDDRRLKENMSKKLETQKEIKRSKIDLIKYRFTEAFKMSIQAILSHKMRSLLTMLGIIIGITSVVSVVAIGNGTQAKIMSDINAMGSNTIMILAGTSFGDLRSGKIKTLKVSDADFLSKQSFIVSTSPNVGASGTIIYKNDDATARMIGVGENFFNVVNRKFVSGRNVRKIEVDELASVVIIDDNTRKEFFENKDPIGETLIFNKKPLKIIGVLEKETSTGGNSSEELRLFAPYTTVMKKITGARNISTIAVRIADNINSQVAEESITKIMTLLHGGKKDFFMINSDSIKQTLESTTGTMKLLIVCIAVISLIVGGIGVMNIMLVSVTERTQEIGIRMAIGAKQNDILEQFLIEAILICLIGGVIGVSLSGIIGIIFNKVVSSFSMLFSVDSIIAALVCSTSIGVIFGYMPARNASNLDPIKALSRE